MARDAVIVLRHALDIVMCSDETVNHVLFKDDLLMRVVAE